jgi:site-specific DNA-adenine methylase
MTKVTCPRCGRRGYLTRVKVHNKYYLRVEHWADGRRRVCYLGRDVSELRHMLMEVIGNEDAVKILKLPGSDYRIADLLLPRLESLCPDKCTFVEVFGGSGYMSQTVPRTKYNNVVYNDINNMLVTLYRFVREHPDQLVALLAILPYSRAYYHIVCDLLKTNKDFGSLATAALIFYAYNTSYQGKACRGFAYAIDPTKNLARTFRNRIWAIVKYAETWRDVTIENLDFREVIKKYDSERTVFYLDPPYPDRAKNYYGVSFTTSDLREMAVMLTQLRGRFLLKLDKSTYELISNILPNNEYRVEVIERKQHLQRVKGRQRGTWTLVLVSR